MNTRLFMPFSGVSLFHSQSAFSSWEIEITLKKPPIVTGWVIYITSSIFSGEDTNLRHAEKGRLKYNGVNIFQRNLRPVFHDQKPLRDGNVPHHAGDGHIRAARLPLVRDKVFDGHLRTVFQPGGKIGETAVQAANPTKKTLLPLKNG